MNSILGKLLPGRVTYRKSLHSSTEERFWSYVDKDSNSPCWQWIGTRNKKGYGVFSLNGEKFQAHRVSWELIHGCIPQDMLICHTCDNPSCVNPGHLFIGDDSDNMQDMVSKGRNKNPSAWMKGDNHPNTKLSEENVQVVRRMYASGGYTYYELAKLFKVSYQLIGYIIQNKRRMK